MPFNYVFCSINTVTAITKKKLGPLYNYPMPLKGKQVDKYVLSLVGAIPRLFQPRNVLGRKAHVVSRLEVFLVVEVAKLSHPPAQHRCLVSRWPSQTAASVSALLDMHSPSIPLKRPDFVGGYRLGDS